MRILQVNSARDLGGGETHVLQLVEQLRRHGHEVVVAGRKNGPLHPDIALSGLRLRSILKQERFDIVHAHVARDYTIVAAAAWGIRRVKVVFTRHLLYPVRKHLLYKRVDGWIAPTPQVLETLQHLKPKIAAVIPNWVDLEKFPYRPHAFHKPVAIALIGQIAPHKGHEDALAAIQELGSGFRLLIAGEGDAPYKAKLRNKAAGLPVEFAGFVTLPEFFAETDMLILPSWEEPFGIILLEAMASGIPVIGTGPRGILHGTFVPPQNSQALAQAIRSCRPDKGVAAARAHVEEHFDIRKIVPRIEEFYRRV